MRTSPCALVSSRLGALTALTFAALLASAAPSPGQQLTAADLPGPDGIIYPDWRYAGVPGGIPTNLVVRATITNAPNTDIAAALESAAATASAAGGGVVSIPAGTYYLSRPVCIRQNNIVIRGAGQTSTTLLFQFQAPVNNVVFYQNPAGATTLYNNTFIQAQADPNGLNRIAISAKDSSGTLHLVTQLAKATGTWGDAFSIGTNGSAIRALVGTGAHDVVAEADYDSGTILTKTATYTLNNSTDPNAIPQPSLLGAINFCGSGFNTSNILLTASATRGQITVQVPSGHGINPGDLVQIQAPSTPTWNAETGNACVTADLFRVCQYVVASVTATSVTFTQPLRLDYPIADGSDVTHAYIKRIVPISGCGVESLTLQQPYNVWTSGLVFSWAYGCWAKNVQIKKPGRMPIYFSPAKNCEMRDSICNDAWYKGEAGTAYCSWDRAYDSLADNMTTYELRHAPLVQWSASGNVFRNSTFSDSDAQWHAGWANENLFENCTILSDRGNGGYGYGLYSSAPGDTLHGPNGPRDVIYNCDVTSPLDGAWLGGSNQQWLFLHNRIVSDTGAGVLAMTKSSDHIIEDNTFLLRNPTGGINLSTADITGTEIVNNRLNGSLPLAALAVGSSAPSVTSGNTVSDTLAAASFSNPGFESGLTGWSTANDNGMTVVTTAAAHSGTNGVRVTDTSTSLGSNLLSPSFSVVADHVYAARAFCRVISGGNGTGLYINFYDSTGHLIRSSAPTTIGTNPGWQLLQNIDMAPTGAVTAQILVHTYSTAVQTVDFDDFSFGEMTKEIPNAGFEYGLEAWDLTGDNGMSAVTTAAAESGTYGVRITDTSTSAGSACSTKKYPATPGTTYQARFWSRINSGSGIGVYLQFFDSTGTIIQPPTLVDLAANSAWTENLVRATAPSNAATVRVQIHSYSAAVVTADFDNFTFLELPSRPAPVTTSIFDWQRNPVYPFASSGFESGLSGWDSTGDGAMTVATSLAAHSGALGIRVTDTTTTAGSSLKSPLFPVAEGYNYEVDFFSRIISGSSGVGVYLIFKDANGNDLSDRYTITIPNSATSWTPFSFQKVAPAGAVSAYILIHSYIASAVTADFDDFSFKAVW